MPASKPLYDLIVLLSTGVPEERRAEILANVQNAIATAGGSIERNDDWGVRGLSYQIDHRSDAEYHLLQFTGPPSLLDNLNYTLRITDGVMRSRIVRVVPGTPPAPSSPPPSVSPTPAVSTVATAATADAAES